jgi:diguanylate cyclase (GGDEF)-like protein/putative nucleotidyltransferase with HDIG domain
MLRPRTTTKKLFYLSMLGLGFMLVAGVLSEFRVQDINKTITWMLLALLASAIQVNIPRAPGRNHSLNSIFVLLAVTELSYAETVLIACLGAAVQIFASRDGARRAGKALFEVACVAIAAAVAYQLFHSSWMAGQTVMVRLAMAAVLLYAGNTFPIAVMAALQQGLRLSMAWRELYIWAFPYYLGGACVASILSVPSSWSKQSFLALALPAAFVIYLAAHLYTTWLAHRKEQLEEISAVHQRTIECLASAIEAKEHSAHDHLLRMRIYSVAIARELGMDEREIEALRIAAILHDVGKLAIPEHILAKSSPLSKEEFEKVKLHATVGAEILDRVHFPYPVASMVRHHHERWDGRGYPAGLSGEAIPLGSRILAAVDCFDALISSRPYRPAYTISEALDRIGAESGLSFDPRVVSILERSYNDLEARVQRAASMNRRDATPGLGHAISSSLLQPADESNAAHSAYDTIVAARREERVLLDLTRQMGNSLRLDDVCTSVAEGLAGILTFDSVAIYVRTGDFLSPRFVYGDGSKHLRSQKIHLGQGVVGQVALSGQPALNEDPALELTVDRRWNSPVTLKSSLAIPLSGDAGVVGVLLLCSNRSRAFCEDDSRLVQSVSRQFGKVLENAIKFEQATSSASTDFLTGLPNVRALSQQIESELARARRMGGELAVLVTDLDGFKLVNDRHGHLEGDRILVAVANALRQACREYDYVGRLGGDEFVVILPGAGEADTTSKVEALERAVSSAAASIRPDIPIGLSVGIARCRNGNATAESLLAEADRAMYRIKALRKGRSTPMISRGYEFDTMETAANG